MIKLNKLQKNAIERFDTFNYVAVNAPRRAGKTEMLKEIIRQSRGKVGVFCHNYNFFKIVYQKEFGTKVVFNGEDCKTIIGDEIFITYHQDPFRGKRIACAGTFNVCKWSLQDIPHIKKIDLKEAKKNLPIEFYNQEFGNYE